MTYCLGSPKALAGLKIGSIVTVCPKTENERDETIVSIDGNSAITDAGTNFGCRTGYHFDDTGRMADRIELSDYMRQLIKEHGWDWIIPDVEKYNKSR